MFNDHNYNYYYCSLGYCLIFFLWPRNCLVYAVAICFHFLLIHWFLTPCRLAHASPVAGAGRSFQLAHAVACPQQSFPSASVRFRCAWSRSFPESPEWAKWVAPHVCPVPVLPQSPSFCCIWLEVSKWSSFAPWSPGTTLYSFGIPNTQNNQSLRLPSMVAMSHMWLRSTWHVSELKSAGNIEYTWIPKI